MIEVGATDFNNLRAPYSNRGGALNLVAPGGYLDQDANSDGHPGGVLQEIFNFSDVWDYLFMEGTSMATPHVSGAVALLLERFPKEDRHAVRDGLTETTRDVAPAGFDKSHGRGLLRSMMPSPTTPLDPPGRLAPG